MQENIKIAYVSAQTHADTQKKGILYNLSSTIQKYNLYSVNYIFQLLIAVYFLRLLFIPMHGNYSLFKARVCNTSYFWILYHHPPKAEPIKRVRKMGETSPRKYTSTCHISVLTICKRRLDSMCYRKNLYDAHTTLGRCGQVLTLANLYGPTL